MAYAFNVNRVTISGTCFGGAEIWSTGFFVGYEDAGASTPTQSDVDAIAARWATYFASSSAEIANDYLTTQVKMSELDTAGNVILDNTVYSVYTTPPAGSFGATQYPPQLSLAVTLKSSLTRGLGSKGRMYLPGVTHGVGSDGHISAGSIGPHADVLKTFFDGVNTDLGIRGQVINASFGRAGTPPTVGVNKEITQILLGNVFDTQRRRRNALAETYTARAIA